VFQKCVPGFPGSQKWVLEAVRLPVCGACTGVVGVVGAACTGVAGVADVAGVVGVGVWDILCGCGDRDSTHTHIHTHTHSYTTGLYGASLRLSVKPLRRLYEGSHSVGALLRLVEMHPVT
jgi:hypothetical protein